MMMSLLLSRLELSRTNVYEPQQRALLGTADKNDVDRIELYGKVSLLTIVVWSL